MENEQESSTNANKVITANGNDNAIAKNPFPTGVDPMMYSLGVEYALEKLEPNEAVEWEDPSFRAGYFFIMSTKYAIAAQQVLKAWSEQNGITDEEFVDLMDDE